MADRIVSIKLTADATGLSQGFNRASDAADQLRSKVSGAGKTLTDTAMSNRQAWSTVGTGLTAVGVAVTGIGVAALKTGIQYNLMQQTTRAALTSLLGSAAAANAQMDKLDDFARNSPFAKQAFIVAQQQMLAFGIEAKNVIPYLDAIQNAVAAAGGSNADIEALAEIFGKISSSSKITAIDLQQFGRRGINAAELIGQSMGKTGAQIREEITAGSIDAEAALDALASGMAEKFAGASDNVKNTFAGAMDRVKAAWRDFAAELATPLVDPNGGGALVDLLNWSADMMRAFESLPEPIKNTTTTMVGLGGAATLAVGAAMLALPKWVEFTGAIKTLGINTSGAATTLKSNLVPAMLAVTVAMASVKLLDWIDEIRDVKASTDDLTLSLRKSESVISDLQSGMTAGNPFAFIDEAYLAEQNLRRLNSAGADFQVWYENSWAGKAQSVSMLGFGRELGQAAEQIEELDGALAGLVASGRIDEATSGFREFAAMATDAGWSQEEITARLPAYMRAQEEANLAAQEGAAAQEEAAAALQEATGATDTNVDSLRKLQGMADEVNESVSALADEILNFGSQNIDAGRSALKFEEELAKLEAQVQNSEATLDRATEAGRANETSLYDMADATKKAAADAHAAGQGQEVVNDILGRGRDQLIRAAEAYGMSREEAKRFADEVSATPETVSTHIRLTGYEEALTQLQQLSRDRVVGIRVQGDYGSGSMTRAYGGTIGFAAGGTIPGYAGGSTVGFGGGVAGGTVWGRGTSKSDSITVRLSKGEEVIQEPYASLNRPLLKAINRGDFSPSMMQPQVVVQGGGNTQVSLAGATFKASIDGRPFTMMIDEQISGAFTGIGRGSMRRDGGF